MAFIGSLVGVAVGIGNIELVLDLAAQRVHGRVHLVKERHAALA